MCGGLGVFESASEESISAGLNDGERCFEFVRDTADEISAHGFESSDIGDITDDNDCAGMWSILDGDDGEDMVSVIAWGAVFEGVHGAVAEGFFDGFEEGGNAYGFVESVSGLDSFADGEESSGAGVDEHEALLLVDGDDAFDHGVKYGGEEIDGCGGLATGVFEAEDAILELVFEFVERAGDISDFILTVGDIEEHIIAVIALYGGLKFSGHDLEWADDAGSDDEEADGSEEPGDAGGLCGDGGSL
ncbi:MAG: hypothetical protein RL215_1491 [Planctomycetota bacterium]